MLGSCGALLLACSGDDTSDTQETDVPTTTTTALGGSGGTATSTTSQGGAEVGGGGSAPCSIESIVADVSTARIQATLATLTGLPERSSHTGQQAAADALVAMLSDRGVVYQELEYDYEGQTYRNIEVELPGDGLASEIYAAGGHYDAVAGTQGADDNASGAATVLEVATVLSGCSFPRTIRLLLFSNEESGCVGSHDYVAGVSAASEDLRGFLALDMVGYGPETEDLDVVTRSAYADLANSVVAAATPWAGIGVVPLIDDACG